MDAFEFLKVLRKALHTYSQTLIQDILYESQPCILQLAIPTRHLLSQLTEVTFDNFNVIM